MAEDGINLNDSSLASCNVWVLGGGITGLTTAIACQSFGLKAGIIAEHAPGFSAAHGGSLIATEYAMASAYPHNLRVANLEHISDLSQAVFKYLCSLPESGVKRYRMYEVFEHEPAQAPLSSRRMKFQHFEGRPDQLKRTIDPPSRPGATYLWGWTFETFFADMPEYLPFLWSMFFERGGILHRTRVSNDSILQLSENRILVNCLGYGAVNVFNDRSPSTIMRGRQVLVPGSAPVTGPDNLPVAYNYTPPAEIFPRADGDAEYVHFFPRSDGWILGQTREPGHLLSDGTWEGDAVTSPERAIGGKVTPIPIVDLNQSLLQSWVGQDLSGRKLIAREGFRYYRDPNSTGVRLQCEQVDNNLIVHNYGHGGSGITMSWGCAAETARLVAAAANQQGLKLSPVTELDRTIINSGDAFALRAGETMGVQTFRI